jgi:hypothetical protein
VVTAADAVSPGCVIATVLAVAVAAAQAWGRVRLRGQTVWLHTQKYCSLCSSCINSSLNGSCIEAAVWLAAMLLLLLLVWDF